MTFVYVLQQEKHTGSIIIMAATIHYNIICYFLTEKVDGTGHQVCRYTRCTRQQAISLNKEPCGESILAQELQSFYTGCVVDALCFLLHCSITFKALFSAPTKTTYFLTAVGKCLLRGCN